MLQNCWAHLLLIEFRISNATSYTVCYYEIRKILSLYVFEAYFLIWYKEKII